MVTLSAKENSFGLYEISSVLSAVLFDENFFSFREIILLSYERKQLTRVQLDFKQIEEKKKFSDNVNEKADFSMKQTHIEQENLARHLRPKSKIACKKNNREHCNDDEAPDTAFSGQEKKFLKTSFAAQGLMASTGPNF